MPVDSAHGKLESASGLASNDLPSLRFHAWHQGVQRSANILPGAMKTGVVMMGRLPRVMGGASGRGSPAGAGSGAGMGANKLSGATPTNPAARHILI